MKKFIYLKMAVLALVLSGCATTYKPDVDYNVNYNFDQVKTYYIHDAYSSDSAATDEVNRFVSDLDNERIINAISSTLQRKALTATNADDADIIVKYLITSKDKTKIRSFNSGFNDCWRCRGFYGYHGHNDVDVKQYVEGTLIIDLVDPKQKKSVWRSVVSSAIKKNRTVSERQMETQKAVDAMLADFKKPKEVLKTTN